MNVAYLVGVSDVANELQSRTRLQGGENRGELAEVSVK